mgnify:CR=1 FL=1
MVLGAFSGDSAAFDSAAVTLLDDAVFAKTSDVLQEVLENVEDTLYHVFDYETNSRREKKEVQK